MRKMIILLLSYSFHIEVMSNEMEIAFYSLSHEI